MTCNNKTFPKYFYINSEDFTSDLLENSGSQTMDLFLIITSFIKKLTSLWGNIVNNMLFLVDVGRFLPLKEGLAALWGLPPESDKDSYENK